MRGAGLFIGLDLCDPTQAGAPDPVRTTAVINELKRNGVLIGAAGKSGSTLKIRPPLCFGRAEADLFLNVWSNRSRPLRGELNELSNRYWPDTHTFADLKTLMAKATPLRSGDCLAGVAAENASEQ